MFILFKQNFPATVQSLIADYGQHAFFINKCAVYYKIINGR